MDSKKRQALLALLKKKKGMKKISKKKSANDFVQLIINFVSKNEKKVLFGIVVLIIAAGIIYYFVRKNKSGDSSSVTPTPSAVAPTITSTALSSDNTSLEVTFSEPVYGSKTGSDSLETTDFQFSLTTGTVKLSSSTPSKITTSDNKTFTLLISLSGTSDGTQELTVEPVANSIFNATGEAATTSQSKNVNKLNDLDRPSMTITASNITSGDLTNQANILLKFASTEATTNFTKTSITVSDGNLKDFGGSGTDYTATLEVSKDGLYDVYVADGAFTDAAGNKNNPSNTFTFTYDGTPPILNITPAITQTTTKPTISGTTEAGCTVTVKYGTSLVGEADVGTDGSFSITSTTEYDNDETYTFTVTSTDKAGNTTSKTVDIFIDTSLPSISITSSSTQNSSTPTITGTTGEGCIVTLKDSNTSVGSTTADKNGNFSITSSKQYADGSYTLTVTSEDENEKTNSQDVYITIDTTPPTLTITSATTQNNSQPTISGTTEAGCTVTVTYDGSSVGSVKAGTLGDFTITSSKTYETDGSYVFTVTSTDQAGNTTEQKETIIIDKTKPIMTITSNTVNSGGSTNQKQVALTFTSTETTTDFTDSAITVSDGNLSSFSGSGTEYTATLTVSEQKEYEVQVLADKFKDAAGNTNSASNVFQFTYDATQPTMTITSNTVDSGVSTNQNKVALKFTSTETTTDFNEGDITVSDGTLSDFQGSGTAYTATLTVSEEKEYEVKVLADKFTDAAGNTNSASNVFQFTYDKSKPIITITSDTVDSGGSTNQDSVQLTFTCSEKLQNFSADKITLRKGENNYATTNLDRIDEGTDGSNTLYKTTLALSDNATYTVLVSADKFTDAAGNTNSASNVFQFTYDTSKPSMTINSDTVDSDGSTNQEEVALTFRSTETTTNFNESAITVSGGELSNFNGSDDGTEYTATLTVSEEKEYEVKVLADKFTDAAGNENTESNVFQFTYDTTPPTMTITSDTVDSGGSTNQDTVVLTFRSTKTTTDFNEGDITVSDGTLSSFNGSEDGTTYTATLTVSEEKEYEVKVSADKFTDAAGNTNSASNVFQFTYDTSKPSISISSDTVSNNNSTKVSPVQLTFRCSERLSNFSADKITLRKGDQDYDTNNLSQISDETDGNDTLYTTTLEVSQDATYTVLVAAGACTDAAGNTNSASKEFKFTYDSTVPSMEIRSQTVSDGGSTNNSKISLTFKSTDETKNFIDTDITVSGGTLSDFQGSGKEYTATLTVSQKGRYTVSVAGGTFTDFANNPNNASNTFSFTYNPFQPSTTWFTVLYVILSLALIAGILAGLFVKNKAVYGCGQNQDYSLVRQDMVSV